MDTQTAMMIVGGAAGYKALELVVTYFFRRVTRDDYITRKDCDACAKQGDSAVDKLAKEMQSVKAILLVIAVKNEIPAEKLTGLTQ